MPFPLHDPQFYLGSAAFLLAAAWLLRGVLPIPWLSRRHQRAKKQRRVHLTIRGQPISKR